MANAPMPPIAPRTGLWGLGFRFEIIGLQFGKMYESTKDVWLIGKWLAWPFYILSFYFLIARDKSWEADSTLVSVQTWIKGIIEGSTLIQLLEHLWWEFRYLRADPIGWVRAKIDQISGELRYLRLDPYGWIKSRLYFAFPVFYSLLGNSGWWVYNELSKRYPIIGDFIRDPWNTTRIIVLTMFGLLRDLEIDPSYKVIDWISRRFGWFWSFMQDPSGFIVGRFASYNYFLHTLVTDPNRWVKERIASVFGMDYAEMDNFTTSIIKRMFLAVLGNRSGLLDYSKNAICELILRFI